MDSHTVAYCPTIKRINYCKGYLPVKGGDFHPLGDRWQCGDIFDCYNQRRGGECYWHLVDRGPTMLMAVWKNKLSSPKCPWYQGWKNSELLIYATWITLKNFMIIKRIKTFLWHFRTGKMNSNRNQMGNCLGLGWKLIKQGYKITLEWKCSITWLVGYIHLTKYKPYT